MQNKVKVKDKERTQEQEQEQKQEQTTEVKTKTKIKTQEAEREALTPDVIYKNNIFALVDDVKELEQFKGLTDNELKNNKSFFPTLVDYIYNNYIGDILGNKRTKQIIYDIEQLDNIFDIYIQLVNRYKWNDKPFIVEFSTFVGISKKTFYQWLNKGDEYINNNINNNNINNINNNISSSGKGMNINITSIRSDIVQKWIDVCERALLNGSDTIRDIFILKAKHNYRDNNNVVEVNVNHKTVISAEELPALLDIKNG